MILHGAHAARTPRGMRVRVTGTPVSCRWKPGSLMRIPLTSNFVKAFLNPVSPLGGSLGFRFWWIASPARKAAADLSSFIIV